MMRMIAVISMICAAPAQQQPAATLKWTWAQGAGAAANGFHVQRSASSGGPYAVVGDVPITTLTFVDNGVAFGRTYFYTVTAYNSLGDSVNSPEITCVVPPKHQGKPKNCTSPVNLRKAR